MVDVSKLASDLAAILSRDYAKCSVVGSLHSLEPIENQIADELEVSIVDLIRRLESTLTPIPDIGFSIDGQPFQVTVERSKVPKDLSVTAAVIDYPRIAQGPERRVKLQGVGAHTLCRVIISPKLARYSDLICELVESHYNTGYAWLREFLRDMSRKSEPGPTGAFYRTLRIGFADKPRLADLVRMVVIDDDHGLYAFDSHIADVTLDMLVKRRGTIWQSAGSMYLSLSNSAVQFPKMFSFHAVRENRVIHCDPYKSEYLNDETLYAISERVLFQVTPEHSEVLAAVPLVRDRQPFLIAGIPMSEIGMILPVLKSHSREIEVAFRAGGSPARTSLGKAVDATVTNIQPFAAGEFFGGAIVGAVKALGH